MLMLTLPTAHVNDCRCLGIAGNLSVTGKKKVLRTVQLIRSAGYEDKHVYRLVACRVVEHQVVVIDRHLQSNHGPDRQLYAVKRDCRYLFGCYIGTTKCATTQVHQIAKPI